MIYTPRDTEGFGRKRSTNMLGFDPIYSHYYPGLWATSSRRTDNERRIFDTQDDTTYLYGYLGDAPIGKLPEPPLAPAPPVPPLSVSPASGPTWKSVIIVGVALAGIVAISGLSTWGGFAAHKKIRGY